jgi:crotonobetainyl-CoA:carnitine CoA-transferase CaiB-like acyl-CoA transferase
VNLPLEGLTVVSIEQAVAAPLATRHLADLGARVIKIERPDGGDFAREYDHVVDGAGAHFVWLNRGKESLAVDLKSEVGLNAVLRLIADADVFIQNLAPGVAQRLGMGSETLRALNAKLIVVELTGYGTGGPLEQRKAYDMLIQAESGLISITGTPETAVKTGIPTADIAAGMYACQGVLAALIRRLRTGEGATIDVSMLEATVEWIGYGLYTAMFTGRNQPRMGLGHASIAPYEAFPTNDGQVLIGVQNDNGWRTLMADVFGAPEFVADPRFVTNVARVRNREECDTLVANYSVRFSSEELTQKLTKAGVPAAEIKTPREVIEHPQLKARNRWREVGTEFSRIPALLPPVTFADVEARMGDVPALGQQTTALLLEAGVDASTIEEMLSSGLAVQSGALER